jgi:hypothetical protein
MRRASHWTPRESGTDMSSKGGAIVYVTDMILPVLIGVNPPQRLAKQRTMSSPVSRSLRPPVPAPSGEVDCSEIVQQIVTASHSPQFVRPTRIDDRPRHRTSNARPISRLKKHVYEVIQTAYRASDVHSNSNSGAGASRIGAITERCRKPSALSFAGASGVEMTYTYAGNELRRPQTNLFLVEFRGLTLITAGIYPSHRKWCR